MLSYENIKATAEDMLTEKQVYKEKIILKLISIIWKDNRNLVQICDEINLRLVSEKLKNVNIVCGDYKKSFDFIDKNTFVYFDPPYRPLTETANFTAYTENSFNDDEQIALAHFVDKMTAKGAKVLVSNSDPKNMNVSDDFFDNIYSEYKIKRVEANRMINCKSEARGKIKELLISNF